MSHEGRQQIVILLGAPGTGKGTQSAWLSRELEIPTVSTGEMLRAIAQHDPEIKRLLAAGSLVSDAMVCRAVEAKLRGELSETGVILDGFPRTVAQAEFLDHLLDELGLPRPLVVHLLVKRDALLARLTARRQCPKCSTVYNLQTRPSRAGACCELDGERLVQRDDDTETVILRRYEDYRRIVTPLVNFYKGEQYYAINGDRDPRLVSSELLDIIAGPSALAA